MNYGYQWFVFAVGLLYGIVIGGTLALKAVGW
jgi:hypothetical protein